jgi:PAS domain S-box-containing protein
VSVLTEKPTTTGLNSFRAILKDLGASPDELDPRARREAAILAFGRRTSAQPHVSLLMQDAGALLTEVLQADLNGVAKSVGSNTLMLTVSGGEEFGKLARPLVHQGPFDPAVSMAAYAMNAAEPIISDDIAHDLRFSDLFLRRVDAVSGLTVPLHASDRVFGALGVYQKHRRPFSDEDVRFTEIICHMLVASLARITLEEEHQTQQFTARTVLDTIDSYVVQLDAEGRVLEANRAFLSRMGYTAPELADRPFSRAFVAPEDIDTVQQILDRSIGQRQLCEFQCRILTRDCVLRQTTWSLSVLCDSTGKARSIILAGVDRTGQLQLEEELRKTRLHADRATEALQQLRARIGEATSDLEQQRFDKPNADAEPGRIADVLLPLPLPRTAAGKDLRSSPRRTFNYRQRIAPIIDGAMPTRRDFFEVECRDISAGGISFFTEKRPDFTNLIVALGVAPLESFFVARIVRVVLAEEGSPLPYMVGCRFTGRVQL